jgi:transcriptional regulator with XRE-family HTH domain
MFEARKAAGLMQLDVRDRLTMSQGTVSELEHSAHGSRRLMDFAMLYGVRRAACGVRRAAMLDAAADQET